jgi:hypothetical protein
VGVKAFASADAGRLGARYMSAQFCISGIDEMYPRFPDHKDLKPSSRFGLNFALFKDLQGLDLLPLESCH